MGVLAVKPVLASRLYTQVGETYTKRGQVCSEHGMVHPCVLTQSHKDVCAHNMQAHVGACTHTCMHADIAHMHMDLLTHAHACTHHVHACVWDSSGYV